MKRSLEDSGNTMHILADNNSLDHSNKKINNIRWKLLLVSSLLLVGWITMTASRYAIHYVDMAILSTLFPPTVLAILLTTWYPIPTNRLLTPRRPTRSSNEEKRPVPHHIIIKHTTQPSTVNCKQRKERAKSNFLAPSIPSHTQYTPTNRFVLYSTMNKDYYSMYSHYHIHTYTYSNMHNYSFLHHPSTFSYSQYRLRGKPLLPHYYRIYAALQLMKGEVPAFADDIHNSTYKYHNIAPKGSLYSIHNHTWLVYIDADAFIAEPFLSLQAILDVTETFISRHPIATERDIECDFIAQEHNFIINSGFYVIRNTTWSLSLIERWIRECEKSHRSEHNMHWVWDQGPLQNAILRVSILCLCLCLSLSL